MNTELIGMILDGIVLVFLAATIYFSVRMSANITAFRKSRKELDKLVQDLARNIDKAELAIAGMKAASRDAGRDLQDLINQARTQSDELQIMTEAGDNLAARMERVADRARETGAATGGDVTGTIRRKPAPMAFDIRDREFEGDDEPNFEDEAFAEDDDDAFQSKAERELFAAINKSRR